MSSKVYEVPVSRRATCVYCADILDTNALGVYQLVTGWCQNRKTGGTNSVTLPQRKPQFACAICIDKLKSGISIGQMVLFDLTPDDE